MVTLIYIYNYRSGRTHLQTIEQTIQLHVSENSKRSLAQCGEKRQDTHASKVALPRPVEQ